VKMRRQVRVERGRGFTLLELLLALVLTTIVALLVYGTVQAALDTRERLRATLEERQIARAVRAILEDGLRNIRESSGPGDSVFVALQRSGPKGLPADRLRFLTGGGLPPLSSEADWIVTLEPTPDGLRLSVAPIGLASPPHVLALLPAVTGLEVRVRATAGPGEWARGWSYPALVPRGVRISFISDSRVVAAPVQVALPLGGRLSSMTPATTPASGGPR
jgi:prepilin-type N-terminal cleavage/methylation domain-containing protein